MEKEWELKQKNGRNGFGGAWIIAAPADCQHGCSEETKNLVRRRKETDEGMGIDARALNLPHRDGSSYHEKSRWVDACMHVTIRQRSGDGG